MLTKFSSLAAIEVVKCQLPVQTMVKIYQIDDMFRFCENGNNVADDKNGNIWTMGSSAISGYPVVLLWGHVI